MSALSLFLALLDTSREAGFVAELYRTPISHSPICDGSGMLSSVVGKNGILSLLSPIKIGSASFTSLDARSGYKLHDG
jgi:hypothetical protein